MNIFERIRDEVAGDGGFWKPSSEQTFIEAAKKLQLLGMGDLSRSELAKLLGVHRATVHRWVPPAGRQRPRVLRRAMVEEEARRRRVVRKRIESLVDSTNKQPLI